MILTYLINIMIYSYDLLIIYYMMREREERVRGVRKERGEGGR